MKKNKLLFFIFLIILLLSIVFYPAKYIDAGLAGLSAWSFNVLPAVLPFMIISSLLSSSPYVNKICKPFSRPFEKMFKASNVAPYVYFLSIISGYPVGSKMIADLYEDGKITQTEAFRLSSFCSNSGPMFIVGAVGIGMLKSAVAGYIILLSHILSALINGLLYRNLSSPEQSPNIRISSTPKKTFGDIIENSCKSILNVGAIIMFFFIIIEFATDITFFLPKNLQCFILSSIEITKGCCLIASNFEIKMATVFSAVVITFGGLSTIIQSTTLLSRVQIPTKTFALQKFTQSLIAGIIALGLSFAIL